MHAAHSEKIKKKEGKRRRKKEKRKSGKFLDCDPGAKQVLLCIAQY